MGKSQRILVLGGYGLIGLSVVRRVMDSGYEVVGLGRDAEHGRRQEPFCEWIGVDLARLTTVEAWRPLLSGIDGIVNASGALQTGLRDNLVDLQEKSIVALIEACEMDGPRAFVQVSAPGADPASTAEFLRTKGLADGRLRKGTLDWVILKPGLVISPNAYGGTALLRMLASFPAVVPIVHGGSAVHTVDVEQVAEAVSLSLDGAIPARTELDLVEEHPQSLSDLVLAFRSWLGLPKPLAVVGLPAWTGRLVGKVADLLGHLGWRSPLRSTALDVLSGGVVGDPQLYREFLGRYPRSLGETLRRYPATLQERWFGVLYMALPLVIATLSLFWIASGVIGLATIDVAAGQLASRGVDAGTATLAVAAGAAVDILLGVGVLFQSRARMALLGMVAVTAAYLTVGSVMAPGLWADPLGPYVKTVPAAVLALIGSMLVSTR